MGMSTIDLKESVKYLVLFTVNERGVERIIYSDSMITSVLLQLSSLQLQQ